jgi:predicted nuclease of predicted toxin-antitoxin system
VASTAGAEISVRFLIDADLPQSLVELLENRGHEAIHVRHIGLRHAADPQIADRARMENRCILTADRDFSDVREYPPAQYDGIVVLGLPVDATIILIRLLVNDFLNYADLVEDIRGKLVIVEPGRIRVRE